jgi:hypothetical protein
MVSLRAGALELGGIASMLPLRYQASCDVALPSASAGWECVRAVEAGRHCGAALGRDLAEPRRHPSGSSATQPDWQT